MNVEPYRARAPLLLQILKERQYSEGWKSRYRSECAKIIAQGEKFLTIDDYIEDVRKTSLNGVVAWMRISCIRSIHLFVQNDIVPTHIRRKSSYSLSKYYDDILEYGIEKARDNGCQPKTLQNYLDTMTTFFLHLEKHGVSTIDEASEDIVLSYFDGEVKRGHTTSRLIIRFIKLVMDYIGEDIAFRIDAIIPRVQKYHRLYRGLTEAERNAIEAVILNGHDTLSLKDRAICALAFYTGLRACDIINLRFSNIDWRRNIISLIQVKTHKELQLRLLPSYGNLLFDYIREERPKVKDTFIFLRPSCTPLDTHDTYRSTVKLLHAAGINIDGAKRGIHLLRHSLATALIVKDTNFAVVTATLGHKSARATYTYLSSEAESLRKCSLDGDKFPINQDYFHL